MKKSIAILLLVAFSVNVLLAQRTRPGVQGVYSPKVEILESTDPADTFAEKGLPQPKIIGENPSDKLAAELARDISKYDDDSLPTLMGTLQKARFYIIDENQKELYRPIYGDGIELAFFDFEVVGMLQASKSGLVTTIAKMAEVIASNNDKDGLPANLIAKSLLAEINSNLKSKDERKRFLASLIVELGKASAKPIDLTTVTPENAAINVIQASLIERIFLGDLVSEYTKLTDGTSFNYNKFTQPVSFVNAAFVRNTNRPFDGCDAITDTTSVIKAGRTATKVVERLEFFRELLGMGKNSDISDALKSRDIKNVFKNYASGISIFNLGMAYVKYFAALLNVKGDISVQSPIPLIRTKNRITGETRNLKAKFSIDFDPKKTTTLNCIGSALEAASGVKFSVPKGGLMKDKPLRWEIIPPQGSEDSRFIALRDYYDLTYLESIDGKGQIFQRTDANGENSIRLVGKPQKTDLSSQALVPVPKQVRVRANIALERMDFGTDAPKIGKFTLVKSPTEFVLGLLEAVPEIASKGKNNSVTINVPVRDWQPCSDDWGGFVNVKRDYSKTVVIKASKRSNGNSTGDGVRTIIERDEADITLNPRTPEEILRKIDRKTVIVVGKGEHSDISRLNREGDPCCGKAEGSWKTKVQEGKIDTYDSIIKDPFRFSVRPTERDYSLSFEYNSFNFPGHRREFKEVDSDCEIDRDESSDTTEDANINFSPSLIPGRYGERVVNSEGELMFGTKEITAGDGAKLVWKWALARCQK